MHSMHPERQKTHPHTDDVQDKCLETVHGIGGMTQDTLDLCSDDKKTVPRIMSVTPTGSFFRHHGAMQR